MPAFFMNPALAAKRTGYPERTLRRWLAEGRIPGRQNPGGRWVVTVDWVEREAQKLAPAKICENSQLSQ